MRRHAYGLVGFAMSTLLSAALVAAFAPAGAPTSAPQVRSYHLAGLGSTSCAGSLTEVVDCSDGSRLFVVRTWYATPDEARAAYDELLGQIGASTLARSVSVDERGRARLIFTRDQIPDRERPGAYAYSSYAVARLDGDCLAKVYGPSLMHAIEYEASLR